MSDNYLHALIAERFGPPTPPPPPLPKASAVAIRALLEDLEGAEEEQAAWVAQSSLSPAARAVALQPDDVAS